MAYRIQLRGAVIEADTAEDVKALLVLMATPLSSRLLSAGAAPLEAEVEVPHARVAGARKRGAAGHDSAPRRAAAPRPRAPKAARGGGVGKATRPARGRVSATGRQPAERDVALDVAVLAAVRQGVSRPRDLLTKVNASTIQIRQALQRQVAQGTLRAEGVTMSRRYYPAGGRAGRQPAAPATEGD